MTFIMTIFRYWRGSVRYVIYYDEARGIGLQNRAWVKYTVPTNYVVGNIAVPSQWFPPDQISQATTFSPAVELTPIDITVPYNSIYEKKLTALPDRVDIDPSSQVLYIWPDTANTGIIIGMSGGDDFCPGYLLPPPNCAQSAPTP